MTNLSTIPINFYEEETKERRTLIRNTFPSSFILILLPYVFALAATNMIVFSHLLVLVFKVLLFSQRFCSLRFFFLILFILDLRHEIERTLGIMCHFQDKSHKAILFQLCGQSV